MKTKLPVKTVMDVVGEIMMDPGMVIVDDSGNQGLKLPLTQGV